MPNTEMPQIGSMERQPDRRASTAMRGARTMGPGRPGVDQEELLSLMFSRPPMEGSAQPNSMPAYMAEKIMSDQRMQAMLRAIQQANMIPSPETR